VVTQLHAKTPIASQLVSCKDTVTQSLLENLLATTKSIQTHKYILYKFTSFCLHDHGLGDCRWVHVDDQVPLELLRNYQICHLIKVFVTEPDTARAVCLMFNETRD
jgi:hypothetical protein